MSPGDKIKNKGEELLDKGKEAVADAIGNKKQHRRGGTGCGTSRAAGG